MNNLNNKNILITGASTGIGYECAKLFAAHGANLILCARRFAKLEEIKQQLLSDFPQIKIAIYQLDVRDKLAVKEFFNSLNHRIDVLINNAGLSRGMVGVDVQNIDDFDEMIDTNVKGLLYVTKYVIAHMKSHKIAGQILNVGSTAGLYPYENGVVYCASKAAVHAISEGLRYEAVEHGIRISEINPGLVRDTEFSLVRFHNDESKAAGVYKNVESITAQNIAEIIVYIINAPANLNISQTVVLARKQASPYKIIREQ